MADYLSIVLCAAYFAIPSLVAGFIVSRVYDHRDIMAGKRKPFEGRSEKPEGDE